MDRISTLSESVSKTSETGGGGGVVGGERGGRGGGADLNSHHMHNHVRPTTSEAGVMAKAKKSVEEELELASVNKIKVDPKPSNRVKTNNFFKMMNNKTNVLTSPR